MIRKYLLIGILLFTYRFLLAQEETYFAEKAQILINQTADIYQPPSMDIGDPEKYYWPKAMGRFEKYGVLDSTANAYVEALKNNSPFHFTLVGMARLMLKYPDAPAIKENKELLLLKVFERNDSHNAWTSEGTENHLNMARTSGYLFAQEALNYPELFPEAQQRLAQMKDWISYWSKRIYQVGNGEWHSGIYETYNLIGWLNLYDFAKDQQVQAMARAVLDYYATEIALYYSYGIHGGAEMRGSGILSSNRNATPYLAWLYFGTTGDFPMGFSGSQYIQSMHAITSNYRPQSIVVKLAQKHIEKPASYLTSRSTYLLDQPSYVKIPFYIGENFTLGSQISGYGGWTGASYQIINWKLVIPSNNIGLPHQVSGNGLFWQNYEGKTRDPFTQYAQYENTLAQLTLVPDSAEAIYEQIESMAVQWNEDWKEDFLIRYPSDRDKNVYHRPEKVNFENAGYLNFPAQASIEKIGNNYLVSLNSIYILIYPVADYTTLDRDHIKGRVIIKNQADRNQLCGFILRVFDQEQLKNKAGAVTLIKSSRFKIQKENYTVQLAHKNEDFSIRFAVAGEFHEPLYDWGYGTTERHIKITSPPFRGPVWPSGRGYGRMPDLVTGKEVWDYAANWPVIDGPQVRLVDEVLTIEIDEESYRVDFQKKLPQFETQ